jgi:ADP-heptose:LPS heptosyltransferase
MMFSMADKRILIIRTGGLGDTLLLWPAVVAIRRRFVTAQIEVMGYRERCALLKAAAGANAVLDIEGSGYHHLLDIRGTLPPEVCARFGVYDVVVAFAAPGDFVLAENLAACGAKEVHAFLPFPSSGESIHVAMHCQRCVLEADLGLDGPDIPIPISDAERATGIEIVSRAGIPSGKLALIAPGSGSAQKNWSPARFAALVKVLRVESLNPVLLEGPADREAVRAVSEYLADSGLPVLRELAPYELKCVLANTRLYVGNDAGPTHLAALLGVPTVAIFGPSDPVLWRPLGLVAEVVSGAVECAPCTSDVMHRCEDVVCLDSVSLNEVIAACRRVLSGGRMGG